MKKNAITLRDVRETDLPIFFAHQREPEANQMAAYAAREHAAFVAHWAKIQSNPRVIVKTICADGEVVGNVMSWQPEDKRLIGYWIGKGYWGRGIASAALAEYLRLIEERPLYAYVAAHNIASVRVLQKAGFTRDNHDSSASHPAADGVAEMQFKLEK